MTHNARAQGDSSASDWFTQRAGSMLPRKMITVLVIDADPVVRLVARRVLKAAGFTLMAVADVSTAIARLAVVRADLVICDVDALVPDRSTAINAIADTDASTQLLTLFPKERKTESMPPCVGNALGKPFTPSELLMKVRRALAGYALGKRLH